MKVNLESYIEKNRERLDVEQPDDERIWNGITRRIDQRRRIIPKWYHVAASILLIISAVTSIILLQRPHDRSLSDYNLLAGISPELAREDRSYRTEVAQKLETVETAGISRDQQQNLKSELNQLDNQYSDYLKDIQLLGNQPKVVNGLLRCYELKLRIIDNTINEIQRIQHYENAY